MHKQRLYKVYVARDGTISSSTTGGNMKTKISVANLVMLAGGAVTLLFSFFSFWTFESYDGGSEGINAWDSDGSAWVSTIPALLGVAMVIWSILELVGTQLPAQVLTFNANQLKATWGIGASGVMLAFLISDTPDRGIGFWLMLLGSLAMAVGAVMALLGQWSNTVEVPGGHHASAVGGTPPPPPPSMGGMTPPPPPPAG